MSLQKFTLDSMTDLDGGKASEAFDLHVLRAAMDCLDRPGDTKPRKVKLEVSLVPVIEADGTCDRVNVQIHASSAVPTHRTRAYSFGLRRGGQLVFDADSPDNVNQGTLLPEDEE